MRSLAFNLLNFLFDMFAILHRPEQDCLRIGRGNVAIFPATKPHHANACLLFITKLISCPKQHLKQEQGIRIDMLQSNNVLSLSGNQEMNKLTRKARKINYLP
ncbi:hypothetical protein NC651_034102 [Populus alba x Populus x berolinensis]|nr:hypothetical protein NC651_034102 [Populus alba x Populus x berolinensis]